MRSTTAHGEIVLTDFGIARSPADMARTATGPGVVMGTPGYLVARASDQQQHADASLRYLCAGGGAVRAADWAAAV